MARGEGQSVFPTRRWKLPASTDRLLACSLAESDLLHPLQPRCSSSHNESLLAHTEVQAGEAAWMGLFLDSALQCRREAQTHRLVSAVGAWGA